MKSLPIKPPIQTRQKQLGGLMEERKIQFLLVSHMPDVYYLTGFRGSAGVAVFGREEAVLFVDPRYTLQAKEQAVGVEVQEVIGRPLEAAGTWLKREKASRVGLDAAHLTYEAWSALEGYLGKLCRVQVAAGLVERLRMIKDPYELGLIRQAANLTSEVFNAVRSLVRPGVAEADLAAEIEYRLKLNGAEGVAFESIVASGPRSALPHARPSSKLLKKNEFVIFDLGAIISGYAADMTRTVYLGKPGARARRIYRAVLEAEEAGILAAIAGRQSKSVDDKVRRSLSRHRLDKYFTHSTGHGVGLEIHESPRISRGETQCLGPGFVVTVEPGVYIEGYGGVRIEDTVAICEVGPEVMTSSPKKDWVII